MAKTKRAMKQKKAAKQPVRIQVVVRKKGELTKQELAEIKRRAKAEKRRIRLAKIKEKLPYKSWKVTSWVFILAAVGVVFIGFLLYFSSDAYERLQKPMFAVGRNISFYVLSVLCTCYALACGKAWELSEKKKRLKAMWPYVGIGLCAAVWMLLIWNAARPATAMFAGAACVGLLLYLLQFYRSIKAWDRALILAMFLGACYALATGYVMVMLN
ncbi:MAG: tryptophan-rich sensory protein [Christensenellales bacterium]|jgi:tryptophan-rich sensory protein